MTTYEIRPKNGWQNMGIYSTLYFYLPANEYKLLIYFASKSFGYRQSKTKPLSIRTIAKDLMMDKNTIRRNIKKLEEKELLKVIENKRYVEGGGSISNSYAPAFPEYRDNTYTYINIKKEGEKDGENELVERIKVTGEEW